MSLRSVFLALLLIVVTLSAQAQLSYSDIDFGEIPYRKVRHYLEKQHEEEKQEHLSELKATCQEDNIPLTDFYTYNRTYLVKAEPWKVWQTYKQASPTRSWTNRKSSCAMIYSRQDDVVAYPSQEVNGIEPGQVLFMDLKLLKGLYHLATAFEITKVEDEIGVIHINYTRPGVNEGKQIISMKPTADGYTVVEHTSYIRSGSTIRDKYLYPFFHNKLINAFHRNMKRMVYSETFLSVSSVE